MTEAEKALQELKAIKDTLKSLLDVIREHK